MNGYPEQEYSAIDDMITAAVRATVRLCQQFVIPDEPGVNVVFHVPGRLLAPDWETMRIERFSRKRQLLLISVPVPLQIVSSDQKSIMEFVIDSLHGANKLGFQSFHKKGIEFPLSDAEAFVDRIKEELIRSPSRGG